MKGIIREYNFVGGVETDDLPVPGTPSSDSDTISKGFADKSYSRSVGNLAALKAVPIASRSDNQLFFVTAMNIWFWFSSASAASGDDITVVVPTAGSGRFLRQGPVGAIVGTTDAQTLSGKNIDGDSNSLLNLALSVLKVVGGASNRVLRRDGSGAVVADKAAPSGDFVGTTDTQPLSNKIYNDAKIFFDQVSYNSQDVASASSILALSATKPFIRLTGAVASVISGLDASGANKSLIIFNASSQTQTFKHNDAAASANNRLICPNATDLFLNPNSSFEFIVDPVQNKWVAKSGSGSGSGGGGALVTSSQTLANNAVIAITSDPRQIIKIKSTGAAVAVTLPSGFSDNQELILKGDDNTDYCSVVDGGNIDQNGDKNYFKGVVNSYVWDATDTKWYLVGGR